MALLKVVEGKMTYETKSHIKNPSIPNRINISDYVFNWINQKSESIVETTNLDSD